MSKPMLGITKLSLVIFLICAIFISLFPTKPASAAPAKPTGVAAGWVNSTSIRVTWTVAAGVSWYYVYKRVGSQDTELGHVSGTTSQLTVTNPPTNLDPTLSYSIAVKAYASGFSPYSDFVSTGVYSSTPPSAPATPANASAVWASSTTATVTWGDVAGETSFKIYQKSGANYNQIGTVNANVLTFTTPSNLVQTNSYTFAVKAGNSAGDSALSNDAVLNATGSVPTAPASVTAVWQEDKTSVNITWTDSSSNETGFKIFQKQDSGTFSQIGNVSANTATYQVTGLTPASAYTFGIKATNGTGDSAQTDSPRLLKAATNITVTWDSPTAATIRWTEDYLYGSQTHIYYKLNGSNTYIDTLVSVPCNYTFYQLTGLDPANRYVFAVAIEYNGGFSAKADSQNPPPASPAAPENITAVWGSNGTSATVSWTRKSTNENAFYIYYKKDGLTTYDPSVTQAAAGSTSATVNGLTPTSTYVFSVAAWSNSGNESQRIASVSGIEHTAPTVVSATAASGQNNLSITADAPVIPNYQFQIYRKPSSGGSYTTPIGTVAFSAVTVTYSDTTATPGASYIYGVSLKNTVTGYETTKKDSSAVTTKIPLTPPAHVVATASTTALAVDLTWEDNTPNEIGYAIYLKNPDGSYTDTMNNAGGGSTSKTITGIGSPPTPLAFGQSYTFAVAAFDVLGYSAKIDAQSAVTLVPIIAIATTNQGTAEATNTISVLNNAAGYTYSVEKNLVANEWNEISNSATIPTDPCYRGETCKYRVRAIKSGEPPTYSPYSNEVFYSNPANSISVPPYWLGHVTTDHLPAVYGSYDVALGESYMYVSSYYDISIYSLSNQVNGIPSFVSSLPLIGSFSVSSSVINNVEYAFVTSGTTLKVISLAVPQEPVIVASLELPSYGYTLDVKGNYAYIPCNTAGLVVVDVSNPANPVQRGIYDSPDVARSVDVEGTRAALADSAGGLVMVNVADPANPVRLGSLALSGTSMDVDLAGNTAWVAAYGGTAQVNVTNASAPSLTSFVPTRGGSVTGVSVDGNVVFAACASGLPAWSGVQIIENRASGAVDVGFLQSLGKSALRVKAHNGKAYVTDSVFLVDVVKYYNPATDKELSITKSADNTTVSSGQTVTVTLTVKNASYNALHSLVVTDPIFAQTSYIQGSATVNGESVTDNDDSSSPDGDDFSFSGIPTWNFTNIVPSDVTGSTVTLTYQVRVN